jgi:hypothetical protein
MAHQGVAADGARKSSSPRQVAAARNVNGARQKVKIHQFGKYLIHVFE